MTDAMTITNRVLPERVRTDMLEALRAERDAAEDISIYRLEQQVLEAGLGFASNGGCKVTVWRDDSNAVRVEICSDALSWGRPIINQSTHASLLKSISAAMVDLRGMYGQAILGLDLNHA